MYTGYICGVKHVDGKPIVTTETKGYALELLKGSAIRALNARYEAGRSLTPDQSAAKVQKEEAYANDIRNQIKRL